jgi:hypothetical protein
VQRHMTPILMSNMPSRSTARCVSSNLPVSPLRSAITARGKPVRRATLSIHVQAATRDTAAGNGDGVEDETDGLQCYTTPEGIMLCSNLNRPGARFMVRRMEDAEMKGAGGMESNWFLAGHTALEYCSVQDNGTLVCNLQEPGVYMVKEVLRLSPTAIERRRRSGFRLFGLCSNPPVLRWVSRAKLVKIHHGAQRLREEQGGG